MKAQFLTLILTFGILSFSQNVKFGKVTAKDFASINSVIDSEAAGELQYKKGWMKIDYNTTKKQFELNKKIENRIKVFKKDEIGENFLSIKIPIYKSNRDTEKLFGLKVVTYNLVDGKVEKTKVKNSDIFTEKAHKYLEYEVFTFPNVKDGSILEYSYEIQSPFYFEADTWYFQTEIPTVYNELVFENPDIFNYSIDMRGGIRGQTTKSSRNSGEFRYAYDIKQYVFKNVPALKDEPFVFNPRNMMASVRHELMQYNDPGFGFKNFSTNWNQIAKDFSKNPNVNGQLKSNKAIQEQVVQLINGSTSPEDKMNAIFDFVKHNIAWNDYLNKYADNGVKKTFKDKQGNSADVNLLLITMLREAKINANPVVLSTVSRGIINYGNPSVTQLNQLICSAEIDGATYLMDATEKNSRIGQLPQRDLNDRGYQINDNGTYKQVPLTNSVMSDDKETVTFELQKNGSVNGRYTDVMSNYYAMTMSDFMTQDENAFHSSVKEQFSDVEIENYKTRLTKDASKIKISFDFKADELADVLSDKIVLNPMFLIGREKNPFKSEERNYPLEFGTPSKKSKIIKIKIPEGYKVEHKPEMFQQLISNNVGGYGYNVQEKDGYIVVASVFECGYSSLPPNFYAELKGLYDKIVEQEGQEIIFSKI